MITYTRINELFGAPLTIVPKPHVPVKFRNWHYAVGVVIILLAVYGVDAILKDIAGRPKQKDSALPFTNISNA
jgi:hypothetical protein